MHCVLHYGPISINEPVWVPNLRNASVASLFFAKMPRSFGKIRRFPEDEGEALLPDLIQTAAAIANAGDAEVPNRYDLLKRGIQSTGAVHAIEGDAVSVDIACGHAILLFYVAEISQETADQFARLLIASDKRIVFLYNPVANAGHPALQVYRMTDSPGPAFCVGEWANMHLLMGAEMFRLCQDALPLVSDMTTRTLQKPQLDRWRALLKTDFEEYHWNRYGLTMQLMDRKAILPTYVLMIIASFL